MQLEQILLATDFSPGAEPAAEAALDFAELFGARLHLFHAIEFPSTIFETYEVRTPAELVEALHDDVSERLEALAAIARARGIEVATEVGEIPAPLAILSQAEAVAADPPKRNVKPSASAAWKSVSHYNPASQIYTFLQAPRLCATAVKHP